MYELTNRKGGKGVLCMVKAKTIKQKQQQKKIPEKRKKNGQYTLY